MLKNCANLILADQEIYQDPSLYCVTTLETRENPTENLPTGWTVGDTINFELMATKAYSTFNCNNIVYDENNIPQYLVGEFSE